MEIDRREELDQWEGKDHAKVVSSEYIHQESPLCIME